MYKDKTFLQDYQMSKLKEEWINNLTDEEIDEMYEEFINAEIFYVEDENDKGQVQGTTDAEG